MEEKMIKFLRKKGFTEDKTINGWVNVNQKKIFKQEALANTDDATLTEKVHIKNNTGSWIVFMTSSVLVLSNDDVKFMFGF